MSIFMSMARQSCTLEVMRFPWRQGESVRVRSAAGREWDGICFETQKGVCLKPLHTSAAFWKSCAPQAGCLTKDIQQLLFFFPTLFDLESRSSFILLASLRLPSSAFQMPSGSKELRTASLNEKCKTGRSAFAAAALWYSAGAETLW